MKVTRAKDREALAVQVEALAKELGAETERVELGPREILVEVNAPHGLSVGVLFDGDSRQDCQVLPWHIHGEAKLSNAFGIEMAASVNPHHRAKCTCVAPDVQSMFWKLRRGIEMAKDGSAFVKPEKSVVVGVDCYRFNGECHTHGRGCRFS